MKRGGTVLGPCKCVEQSTTYRTQSGACAEAQTLGVVSRELGSEWICPHDE